jgi:hypothetical protein
MKMQPFEPDYADLFTVNEFVHDVREQYFQDEDGSGYYGTPDQYDRDAPARPSEIHNGLIYNNGYGYVHWFNK